MRERPRPLPHDVGHGSDSHPSHRFQRREYGTQKPGAHSLGHWRTDKKADDVIAYFGPDDKLGKSPFPKAPRKRKAFESCVSVVSASSLHLDTGIPART